MLFRPRRGIDGDRAWAYRSGMEPDPALLDRFLEATVQPHLDGETTFEEAKAQLNYACMMAARGDKGLEAFMRACLDTSEP